MIPSFRPAVREDRTENRRSYNVKRLHGIHVEHSQWYLQEAGQVGSIQLVWDDTIVLRQYSGPLLIHIQAVHSLPPIAARSSMQSLSRSLHALCAKKLHDLMPAAQRLDDSLIPIYAVGMRLHTALGAVDGVVRVVHECISKACSDQVCNGEMELSSSHADSAPNRCMHVVASLRLTGP